jgi:hypothetical protein
MSNEERGKKDWLPSGIALVYFGTVKYYFGMTD